jgi:hypothetical protein
MMHIAKCGGAVEPSDSLAPRDAAVPFPGFTMEYPMIIQLRTPHVH